MHHRLLAQATQRLLERAGDGDRLAELVERLEVACAAGAISAEAAAAAVERLVESSEPERVLLGLVQLCDGWADAAGASSRAPIDAAQADTFVTLAVQGSFPTRTLVGQPSMLAELDAACRRDVALDIEALTAELVERIDRAVDAEGSSQAEATRRELRRIKRRESLRIFLREVDGRASVRQTTAEIADLAEACLDVAVDVGARVAGDATLADELCILGMGKLGGRELNFSSDVDLIYLCSDAAAADAERKAAVDQLARWVTAAIDDVTADGYVFRVDLRLRPEGSKGELVPSLGAMVEYYQSWGRTWERSAMLKARPVGGRRVLGERLLEQLEGFLFRRYLDYDVLDELQAMKDKIDRSAHVSAIVGLEEQGGGASAAEADGKRPAPAGGLRARLRAKMRQAGRPGGRRRSKSLPTRRGDRQTGAEVAQRPRRTRQPSSPLGWDVKIGVGGIREIEFFVQALQLVHCGMRPALRVRNTLQALDRLLYTGLITHGEHALLADAYDLFRRVEHRVQMEQDRQAHRLPPDPEGFGLLAERLGTPADALKAQLTDNRRGVARMFDRLFAESERASEEPTVREERPDEIDTVLGASSDDLFDQAVLDAIGRLGFERPRQLAGQLQVVRDKDYGPFGRRAGAEMDSLAGYLLEACAEAPEPNQAFTFLSRLIQAVGDRAGFYRMLYENPHAARLLVLLFGSSGYLASILVREPNVIERLLGAGTAEIVRSRRAIAAELDRRLEPIADRSHRLGRIRRYHQEETLRIALHEVAGVCPVDDTVSQLALVAEVIIAAVLAEVYDDLVVSQGLEAAPPLDELPFCVLAMGKLGGQELSFGSDVDVIFVYTASDHGRLDHVFFSRLAQRLVRRLSSVSQHGKLYDVDTRLRPSGSQGTLVVSLEAFIDYHRDQADLWERQAMVRARPITGANALRRRLMALRQTVAFERPLPDDAAAQVARMRHKIVESFGSAGGVDIKTSPGGMLDCEFLTQFLQLRYASVEADVDAMDHAVATGRRRDRGLRTQNTLAALEALQALRDDAEGGFAAAHPGVDPARLATDYRVLRRVEARLRMGEERESTLLPDDPERLGVLARRLGYQGAGAGAQLRDEIEAIMGRIAAASGAVLGGG